MRRAAIALLATVALTAALAPAPAGAAIDNAGNDFWLAFPTNYNGTIELTLFITGSQSTTGTVSIPGQGFSQNFNVTPGSVTSVSLPSSSQMQGTATEAKGIRVTAGKEVVVYGLSRQQFTTDAFLGLPVDALGTKYTVLGWGIGCCGLSETAIAATQDGTTVTITPKVDAGGGRPAGTAFNVPLNRGQVFQLQAANQHQDLTGTRISSNRPVAVFSGHGCANIPDASTGACDHVVEQNPPESAWGTSFLTMPLKTRLRGDTFVFVASQANTQVRVNGTLVATLGAGQRHQRIIDGRSQIQSTKPILVAQYSNGSDYDRVTSDPFQMQIPPFEQFQTNYTVTTPASGFRSNFINVIARNSAVGDVKVDGTAIPPGSFSAIGSSGFSGAQVNVSLGTHRLTSDGQPFGAFMYGFDSFDSYGYAGGSSLAPIASVSRIALSPPEATRVRGTRHCVTAAITGSNGAAVPGVRIDWTVGGANSAAGNTNADSNGRSQFCYTGNNLGADTISAGVGAVRGSARSNWVTSLPTEAPRGQVERGNPVRMRIHHKALVALRGGRIVVVLSCRGDRGKRCAGVMTMKGTRRRSRLSAAGGDRRARFDFATGKRKRMVITPTSDVAQMLKARRKAVARITARFRQTRAPSTTIKRLITIQPRAYNEKK